MKQLISASVLIDDAAGTAETYYLTPASPHDGEWELVQLLMTPLAAVSLHATNYRTVSVKNGATTIGSWTSNSAGGTALSEAGPLSIDVSGNGMDAEFTANTDPVVIESTPNSSGVALKAQVTAVWERVA